VVGANGLRRVTPEPVLFARFQAGWRIRFSRKGRKGRKGMSEQKA